MRTVLRLCLLVSIFLAYSVAMGDASIRLSTFPTFAALADGKSTVTVKAEVRDQNGHVVPDGTPIIFETNLEGTTFRQASVSTVGGLAFGTLVAGTKPGTTIITATAITVGASPATATFEFVATRSELSSAKEYIEIVSPDYMQFVSDPGVNLIAAASPNGKVTLRYKNLSLTADDIQYSINNYELRGKKVKLTMGKFTQDFDELYLILNDHGGTGRPIGYGTTTFKAKRSDSIVTQGKGLVFVSVGADGSLAIPPDGNHYGMVDVYPSSIQPNPRNMSSLFTFKDILHATSTISARKAIIFPKRKIQFQRAKIYVAGSPILTMPLYEYNLVTATPLVTEQMLAVVNSQVQVNYPYFLSMKPGETSYLELRTGNQYGLTQTADTGVFLDYELHWDRGDDMQGSFIFSGIGRDDWTAGFNEYVRLDDRTSTSVQVFSPTGTSYEGTATASHQFNGFSTSVNADESRTVQGIQYSTSDYAATIAKDPIKVGATPFHLYLEVTATSAYNELIHETQTGEGARARLQSAPIPIIDRSTNATITVSTSYLKGENELNGPQYLGSVAVNHKFSSALSSVLTYNFTKDGFNQYVIGEHQVTLQSTYTVGPANLSLTSGKSLDLNAATVFADLGYRFGKKSPWRIKADYTYDDYLNTTYIDYDYGFTYRLGWREVGLIWDEQSQRIGFQLLGTTVF